MINSSKTVLVFKLRGSHLNNLFSSWLNEEKFNSFCLSVIVNSTSLSILDKVTTLCYYDYLLYQKRSICVISRLLYSLLYSLSTPLLLARYLFSMWAVKRYHFCHTSTGTISIGNKRILPCIIYHSTCYTWLHTVSVSISFVLSLKIEPFIGPLYNIYVYIIFYWSMGQIIVIIWSNATCVWLI